MIWFLYQVIYGWKIIYAEWHNYDFHTRRLVAIEKVYLYWSTFLLLQSLQIGVLNFQNHITEPEVLHCKTKDSLSCLSTAQYGDYSRKDLSMQSP